MTEHIQPIPPPNSLNPYQGVEGIEDKQGHSADPSPSTLQVNKVNKPESVKPAKKQKRKKRSTNADAVKLNPALIKARKSVALIMQGKTYTETGQQVFPHVAYPRQSIYEALQRPAGQQALEEVNQYYDKAKIRRIINAKLDKIDSGAMSDANSAIFLGLAARTEAMLTDKTEAKVTTEQVSHRAMDKLALDTLSELAVSSDGIKAYTDLGQSIENETDQISSNMDSCNKSRTMPGIVPAPDGKGDSGAGLEIPRNVDKPIQGGHSLDDRLWDGLGRLLDKPIQGTELGHKPDNA